MNNQEKKIIKSKENKTIFRDSARETMDYLDAERTSLNILKERYLKEYKSIFKKQLQNFSKRWKIKENKKK